MLRYFALLLASAALFSSCSSSTPSGPAAASEFVHAHAGSTFTFDEYSTDSMNMMIPGSRDTMLATILRTDGNVGGHPGVLIVEEKRGSKRDTSYYAYKANNDFSVYVNPTDPSFLMWETIPTGTGTTIVRRSEVSMTGIDTTVVLDSTITSLVGSEDFTIKGQTISSKRMQLRFREVVTMGGVKVLDWLLDEDLYYAPSLGFEVKTVSPSYDDDPFGKGWIAGRVQTLIDYNLK